MARMLRWGLVVAGAITLALGAVLGLLWLRYTSPGPLAAPRTLVIPKAASIDQIAARLAGAGILAEPHVFALMVQLDGRGRRLRAGEYAFPAAISARAAAELIASGRTVMRRFTVAEGLTSAQIVAQLRAAEGLEGEPGPPPPEGTLLPQTYFYTWGDGRQRLIERQRQAMAAMLDELWPARAPSLALASAGEAVVLASIVEKETARPEERARVAAVFLNRLKRGMRLQADPTVVYGLTQGLGPLERALSRADLQARHPWNTYVIAGLPPTPIANPGRAALVAALNPAPGEELYFVADGSGGHFFAETLAEHNRNVQRLRQIERERGAASATPSSAGAPSPSR